VRVDVILSLNDDVWKSAFLPRLSDGLADRLSEIVVELEPLTKTEMLALLDSRAPGLGERIFERLNLAKGGEHARGLIRSAGVAWMRAAAQVAEHPAPIVPVAPVAPIAPIAPIAPAKEISLPPVVEPVAEPAISSEPTPITPAVPLANEPPVSWPEPGFADLDDDFVPHASAFLKDPLDDPFGGADWDEAFPVSTPFALEAWEIAETAAKSPETENRPATATFTLPEDSPFIAVPSDDAPEKPSEATASREPSPFSIPASERPARIDPPVLDTPFKAMVQEEKVAVPVTAIKPPAPPAATQPSESPAETDRVDDLLRQFRERYGRGSL
jgi:hypothetical protein